MKYEIHVDSLPDPTGGWSQEFRVELHFDDNPGFTATDPTLGGQIMHVKFEGLLSDFEAGYLDSLVRTQLLNDYPQLRRS